jgi:post-segregation antitoxin (ccd killing protein)
VVAYRPPDVLGVPRVPKINVYLPVELATSVRELEISVSPVCQLALESEVRRVRALHSVGGDAARQAALRLRRTRVPATGEDEREGYEVGLRWALEKATDAELRRLVWLPRGHWRSIRVDHEQWPTLLAELRQRGQGALAEHGGVDVYPEPFIVGLVDGATAAYRAVQGLID